MSTQEITAKLHELRELQDLIEEAEAQAEAIRDAIKAHMGAQEELRAGEYKVTWKSVEAVRFDSKALRAARPDIYTAFSRKTATRRFCVV